VGAGQTRYSSLSECRTITAGPLTPLLAGPPSILGKA
jgi:hypothetical protein